MNGKSRDEQVVRPHWSFWPIVIIALLWNILGVMNFFRQMDPEVLAGLPDWMRSAIETRPAWATASFAVAVFGGAFGCILLLFRKSLAFYALVVSFVGVVLQMLPLLRLANYFGLAEVAMIVTPLLVAGFLAWYASYATRQGWVSNGAPTPFQI